MSVQNATPKSWRKAVKKFESSLGTAWQTEHRPSATSKSLDRDWGKVDSARADLVESILALETILYSILVAAGNPSPELLKRAAAVLAAAEGGDNG